MKIDEEESEIWELMTVSQVRMASMLEFPCRRDLAIAIP